MVQANKAIDDAVNDAKPATLRIGVDVGGTKIEAVLIGGNGTDRHGRSPHEDMRVLASVRVPARPGEREVVEDINAVVAAMMRAAEDHAFGSVEGVGIGTPGRVDGAAGTVENIANLNVSRLELSREIGDASGLPVHVENDVNAAALGAYALLDHGSDDGADTGDVVVFLNLGTGLAAGILRNGRLDHGSSGVVGEIGHIPIEPHRWDCPCGQSGCLETAAGGRAIMRQWPDAVPPMPDILAKASDPSDPKYEDAKSVKHTVINAIADAIDVLAVTVDPAVMVLGGGTAKTGEPLVEAIREELRCREQGSAFITSLHLADRIALAPLDSPIGAIGAGLSW